MLSVVIVSHNRRDLLHACLVSAEAALAPVGGGELIVVDNGSTDQSVEMVQHDHIGATLLPLDHNTGFAVGVAKGIAIASGEWIALVNNDAELEPSCLAEMLRAVDQDHSIGAANAQVRFAAHRNVINTTGIEIDKLGIAYDRNAGRPVSTEPTSPVEVFGVSGCVAIYRAKMLRDLGGFDPAFFAYAEDADLAWRARAGGWRAIYVPSAIAYHRGSATAADGSDFKYELVGRNRVRLIARNATTVQLARCAAGMVLYDVAYIIFIGLTSRTLAPLRGRVRGLREWPEARRSMTAQRRPVALCGCRGALNAWRMRGAYARHASPTR